MLPALQLHFSQQNEDMHSLQTQRTELAEQLAAMKKAMEARQAEVSSPARLVAHCGLCSVVEVLTSCGLRQGTCEEPCVRSPSTSASAPPSRSNSQAVALSWVKG